MRLIQQAYEDKYQALIEEVNTWKWISEEQSTQVDIGGFVRLSCSNIETMDADLFASCHR